jgi:hypothetical protein
MLTLITKEKTMQLSPKQIMERDNQLIKRYCENNDNKAFDELMGH